MKTNCLPVPVGAAAYLPHRSFTARCICPAGAWGDGTVSMTQHQEEIRYLSGDNARLKERLAAMEKELAVAHALQVGGARAPCADVCLLLPCGAHGVGTLCQPCAACDGDNLQ